MSQPATAAEASVAARETDEDETTSSPSTRSAWRRPSQLSSLREAQEGWPRTSTRRGWHERPSAGGSCRRESSRPVQLPRQVVQPCSRSSSSTRLSSREHRWQLVSPARSRSLRVDRLAVLPPGARRDHGPRSPTTAITSITYCPELLIRTKYFMPCESALWSPRPARDAGQGRRGSDRRSSPTRRDRGFSFQ